tara:strand:+ start:740 stop:865 length:126 start_codon:yes stop_codon:yes gene_type:complete
MALSVATMSLGDIDDERGAKNISNLMISKTNRGLCLFLTAG